jgi:hypothetical protein
MFKKLEYVGFEDRPDLRAKVEALTPVLAGVVRDWDKRIELELADRPGGVGVTLALDLPAGRGTGSRLIGRDELSDPDALESQCRAVWASAMDDYLDRRRPAWEEIINQPVGV